MKSGRIVKLALPLVLTVLLTGWTGNWESIQDSMRGIESIQAEFVQTKELRILSKPLVSRGRFYYRSPDNLRWEYIEPIKTALLLHNGKAKRFMWHNGAFVEDASANLEPPRIVMQQIIGWLNADFKGGDVFGAELLQTDPAQIVLTPQDAAIGQFIERVIITLSETPGIIESITIQEQGDASTRIEFQDVILNQDIADETFRRIK